MCIICIKPSGVKMPDTETIENMWYSNRDGAGFMYVYNGSVHINKGHMTLKSFKHELEKVAKIVDTTNTPFILHFRIGTHGENIPENTHPFPVSEHVHLLQKRKLVTNVGVAHNGIIDIRPRKDISDTMEYIVSQMSIIKQINKRFYLDEKCMMLMRNAVQSKLAFLDKDGQISTVGEFHEETNGLIYSNRSYKPVVSYAKWDTDYKYPLGAYTGGTYNERYTYLTPPIETALMWLNEDGAYVKNKKGTMIGADEGTFLIDRFGNVYEMDLEVDMAYPHPNYAAFNSSGLPAKFNEEEAEIIYVEY